MKNPYCLKSPICYNQALKQEGLHTSNSSTHVHLLLQITNIYQASTIHSLCDAMSEYVKIIKLVLVIKEHLMCVRETSYVTPSSPLDPSKVLAFLRMACAEWKTFGPVLSCRCYQKAGVTWALWEMLWDSWGQTWVALIVTQQACKTFTAVSHIKRSGVEIQRWG